MTVTRIHHGALPALQIDGPGGAQAIVTLFGAHVVSWHSADGRQRLFCSSISKLDGSRSIRGGVPLIFPQFSGRGDGMRHGFARISTWRHESAGAMHEAEACSVELMLTASDLAPEIAAAWPHDFGLSLRVTLQADALTLAFRVRNCGQQAMAFSAALHSYYLIDALAEASIEGLQEVAFCEQREVPPSGAASLPDEVLLRFNDKIDRIYRQAPGPLILRCKDQRLRLEQTGFGDAVVWNPGPVDSAALSDMAEQEYQHFICIEPAQIDAVTLAPGAQWSAQQTVHCEDAEKPI